MFKLPSFLIIIDKEYLNSMKNRSEQREKRILNIFFIVYLMMFLISCLLVVYTNYGLFFLFIFFPYIWIFSRRLDQSAKKTIVLLKNKYVKLSFLFSVVFFSLGLMFFYFI